MEARKTSPRSVRMGEYMTMSVKELRKALGRYPDDMQVVLSSDEEGNGFNELYDVAESMCVLGGWIDQVYVMDDDIGKNGYTEEDRAPRDAVKVVVLWP